MSSNAAAGIVFKFSICRTDSWGSHQEPVHLGNGTGDGEISDVTRTHSDRAERKSLSSPIDFKEGCFEDEKNPPAKGVHEPLAGIIGWSKLQ